METAGIRTWPPNAAARSPLDVVVVAVAVVLPVLADVEEDELPVDCCGDVPVDVACEEAASLTWVELPVCGVVAVGLEMLLASVLLLTAVAFVCVADVTVV